MIGIRAHDLGRMNPKDMAFAIHEKGFTCTHLALYKAIEGFDTSYGKLSPGLAKQIRTELSHKGISIAVLGCYINPVHPEEEIRRVHLNRFKECIRFVRDFGCSVVATETGNLNSQESFPEAFERVVESVEELVQEAEKFGVFVCLEGVTTDTISTPVIMKRVIDRVKSNNLQVLFDPVNLLDAHNAHQQKELIQESFELFGDRILILHAKDFILENQKKKVVPAGKGLLDYPFLFKQIKKHKPGIKILLEDIKPEYMESSRVYLETLLEKECVLTNGI